MIRRSLKDKESSYLTISDINSMTSGDSIEVYVDAPIQTNGYFLGYNNGATGTSNNTNVYSQLLEQAYINHKRGGDDVNVFNLKNYDGSLYLLKNATVRITDLPTVTVRKVLLLNGSRYLGVNGTSITSTTSQSTAVSNEIYHWNLVYNQAGRFRLYNPTANRYIRYSNSAFSLNTSGTSLYVAINSSNFRIMGSDGSNYMYMSSNTALARNQRTAQNWTIYALEIQPNRTNTTSGTAPTWKYPTMAFTVSQAAPSDPQNLLAGYKSDSLIRLAMNNGNTGMFLNHKTSVSNLQFTTGGTSCESTWVLINKNATREPEAPEPINEQIDTDWMRGYSGGSYNWNYTTGDFEMTFTGEGQKLLFWMHDGSDIGTKVYWADIEIYENGNLITNHSKYQNIGWYCGSNPKYSVTEGCTLTRQNNTDTSGTSRNSVQFNTSSSVSESINWPLTIKIYGLYFE